MDKRSPVTNLKRIYYTSLTPGDIFERDDVFYLKLDSGYVSFDDFIYYKSSRTDCSYRFVGRFETMKEDITRFNNINKSMKLTKYKHMTLHELFWLEDNPDPFIKLRHGSISVNDVFNPSSSVDCLDDAMVAILV